MKRNSFIPKVHNKRTSNNKFSNYRDFFDDLRNDFNFRCGYCGTSCLIVQDFEVDHFIPFAQFKERKPELETTYKNLVFSCKKCNRTKAGKFKDGTNAGELENVLFYDPGEVDFNLIFFRDNYGFIFSDDPKGKEMIKNLKLYNPFYGLAWTIEQINNIISNLGSYSNNATSEEINEINSLIADISVKKVILENIFNSGFQKS